MIDAVARVESRISSIEQRFGAASFRAALAQAASGAGDTGQTAALPPEAVDAVAAASGGWRRALPAAAQRVLPQLEAAATAAGVDPRLLASLTWAESGFATAARSSAGAIGLTQLMPATAAGLGVDPHDPVQNLTGGARYLRQQLDRFGSVELALAAYNAGPATVARAGGVPAIRETQDYVARVTRYLETLGATP